MYSTKKSATPNRRATDNNALIDARLLVLAYQNLPAMIFVNIAATLGAAYLLRAEGNYHLIVWLAAIAALSLLRVVSWRLFAVHFTVSETTRRQVNFWMVIYALGLFTAAGVWVTVAYIAFQTDNVPANFSIIVIIAALAGGATGITAPLKYCGRIYITLLLFVTSVVIYIVADQYWGFSTLGFIFWVVMIISHRNNHKILLSSLTLETENKYLIENLRHLNLDLEARVNQRTEALKRLAHHDALTGLPNRPGLIEWMEKTLDKNNPAEAAILFLDLDRFKQINDALGHEIGDQVLRMVAFRFNELCPKNAILARWGGDEFLLITSQKTDIRKTVESLARELICVATAPLQINGESLGLGLSIGMSYFPTDASNYADAIHAADLTVAEVKRNGRGHSLIYNEIYAETQKRRFELGRALSEAIKRNALTLAYQPVVNAKSGEVETLEVLARWRHSELGEIDPCEFIYLAEETDRIIALGDWVLYESCSRAQKWRASDSKIQLAINVSIKQLLSPHFPDRVKCILGETQFPPRSLILEVTESLFGEEYLDVTLRAVTELKQLGINVYIDDFGTGYSSLSRLHQFPVSGIKIDKSFVAQLENQGLAIVESALYIASRMNLNVIVEGVETLAQVKKLSQLGVKSMQGFYFCKPSAQPTVQSFDSNWR